MLDRSREALLLRLEQLNLVCGYVLVLANRVKANLLPLRTRHGKNPPVLSQIRQYGVMKLILKSRTHYIKE